MLRALGHDNFEQLGIKEHVHGDLVSLFVIPGVSCLSFNDSSSGSQRTSATDTSLSKGRLKSCSNPAQALFPDSSTIEASSQDPRRCLCSQTPDWRY